MDASQGRPFEKIISTIRYVYHIVKYYSDRIRYRLFFRGYFIVFKSPLSKPLPPLPRINIDLNFKIITEENFDEVKGSFPVWKQISFIQRLKNGCIAIICYSRGNVVSYGWFAETKNGVEDFDWEILPGEIYAFDAWVNYEVRGRGIAYYNFKFIYEFFHARGFDTYMHIVETWNRIMLRLCSKIGLEVYGILKHRSILGIRRTYLLPPGEEESRVAYKHLSSTGLDIPERTIKFKLITHAEELELIRDAWNSSVKRSSGYYRDIDFDGLLELWDADKKHRRMFFLAGIENRSLKSIFPFVFKAYGKLKKANGKLGNIPVNLLSFIGRDESLERDFIIDNDDPVKHLMALLDVLFGPLSREWEAIELGGFSTSNKNYEELARILKERGYYFQVVKIRDRIWVQIFNNTLYSKIAGAIKL
ncbi:MAG: hypothetical protein GF307_10655 [candidate division Zixibacteria bacterium]|nr:hypothetical protein [candidate division Zixibacteria bacterium]